MDGVKNGDESEIKLSAERMVGTKGEPHLDDDEAREAAGPGNGPFLKVPSSNKASASAPGSPKSDWQTLVQRLLEQAVSKSRTDQWGLLTAVTEKARKRPQGCHVMLHSAEHVLGRMVAEVSCMFESPAVSGRHCTITRRPISFDGRIKDPGSDRAPGDVLGTFVKDSSSNGTFINKEKLKKNGPEVRLRHGDMLSLVALPEHESAFAFVFREVIDESSCKRKGSPSDHEAEVPPAGDGKRIRCTGKCIAASEGPVSLDDVRRLQRSNEELRQQVEANVLEREKMRGEFRDAEALHLVQLEEVRGSTAEMYVKQVEEIRLQLASKSKEAEESTALCSRQETTIEDLNRRAASAAQSRVDAEEAIRSHAISIAELKKRLDEECSQHQKERAEWEANLEAAVERTRMEAAEELKRHSDASARLQKQQQDTIADLEEADQENRRLADSLRVKLEAERQAAILLEEKGRRLGMQIQEERVSTENACKKAADLQEEMRVISRELDNEKEAREFAGAKVTSLELAMETAIRDLTLEKQRLQGARERLVLREAQLRTFYSTAAQVEALQQKQQEHLKVMLRTLEDGDGEGDYPETRTLRFGQSECGANEADRLPSLGLRQTSSPPSATLLHGEGLHDHTGNGDGVEKKYRLERGQSSSPKAGNAEPDWMDGDTQQEDDACLLVPNSPSTLKPAMNGADVATEDQDAGREEGDTRHKVENLTTDQETQVLQDHGIAATTQLLADTLEEIGSREGQAFLMERVGLNSRFWPERRKSNLGMGAPGSASRDDRIAMGRQKTVNDVMERRENETVGLSSGGATMEIQGDRWEHVESVGTGTAAENDGLPHSGSPVLNLGSRMSGAYEHSQVGKRNNEAGTICTDDLLTSEVAGSWALGTQASVHTGNDVASPVIVGFGSGALNTDTQLMREQEGTMCTDDLLASEVAGSWAAGTPASVHADNESISSDERDLAGPDEGGSQVAATLSRRRSDPRHVLLEDVTHFADPVNSQNSLSPATTIPPRNERDALNEMLDIVEPGFGSLHSHNRFTRGQSDIDDSTTDEDENEKNICRDGSRRLNQSPSVSVK